MRHIGAGIRMHPKLAGLFSFFEVPGDLLEVDGRYKVLLRLANTVAQFVCLAGIARRDRRFSSRRIPDAQPRIGDRKIWVEFDGALKEGDSKWGSFPTSRAKRF